MSILTSAMMAAILGAAVPAVEAPIHAPGSQGALAGTLIALAQGKRVVLIIPGSGLTDRDGNSAMGILPGSYGLPLAVAQPDATFVKIPDMNHVLKLVAGDDRASSIASGSDPVLPVAPDLVAAITRFVFAEKDAS